MLEEKPMVIVVPSYNNIKWHQDNLKSLINQEYKNFRIIYIDDHSKDDTAVAVQMFLEDQNIDFLPVNFDIRPSTGVDEAEKNALAFKECLEESHFFYLIKNEQRCGAFENLFRAIYSCQDDAIIVTVDGDDWLPNNHILSKLNETYANPNVWLTHGKLKAYPNGSTAWCIPVPSTIVKNNAFRTYRCPSHLRTFYAGLFKKIKTEDLLYEEKFFSVTWDMAMMFPMIEMAGERHAFMNEVTYIYNMANPISDQLVHTALQNKLDKFIRSMPPYQRLDDLTFSKAKQIEE